MTTERIRETLESLKESRRLAIERGDSGQAAACNTNIAAFAAILKRRSPSPRP